MKEQSLPILLNIFAAVLGALGQYAYKKGGTLLGQIPIYKNYHLFSGIALFCVVMLLFVIGYKMGGRISVVYPFYATTFLWGVLLGHFLDGEPLNMGIWSGSLLIIIGLVLVAKNAGGVNP